MKKVLCKILGHKEVTAAVHNKKLNARNNRDPNPLHPLRSDARKHGA
jgi:hypothetical protein